MSDAAKPRLKVSRDGLVLIKSLEGFRPHAVRAGERWMIGYGHTASARQGATVTEAEAELLLQYDLRPVVQALHALPVTLNQRQFDALASFALSTGANFAATPVARRLAAGRLDQAAEAMMLTPAAPHPDMGLHRRAAERAMFDADARADFDLSALLAAPMAMFPAAPASALDARAAALAALLDEGDEPSPFPASPEAEPVTGPWDGPAVAASAAPATAPVAPPAPQPAPAPVAPTPAEPLAAPAAASPAPSQPHRPERVVRHEVVNPELAGPTPAAIALYVIMGVLGLIALATAAVTLAVGRPEPTATLQPAVIAWALAGVGAACVGVSGFSLLRSRRAA